MSFFAYSTTNSNGENKIKTRSILVGTEAGQRKFVKSDHMTSSPHLVQKTTSVAVSIGDPPFLILIQMQVSGLLGRCSDTNNIWTAVSPLSVTRELLIRSCINLKPFQSTRAVCKGGFLSRGTGFVLRPFNS